MCGIILLVLRILDYNNIKNKHDKLIKGTSGWRSALVKKRTQTRKAVKVWFPIVAKFILM